MRTRISTPALLVALSCLFFLLSSPSFAGTVAGKITLANTSVPLKNATLTFTPTQVFYVSGTSLVVSDALSCYTTFDGSIVGMPDPTVVPTVTADTSSGTLAAGTYDVAISYYNATTETLPSPVRTVNLSGTGRLIVTAPTKQPALATGYSVYIALTGTTVYRQTSVVGWGNFTQSTSLAAATGASATNTSTCSLRFNDEGIPSWTGYTVNLVNSFGSAISGFPMTWYLYGGSSGTINVSNGYPISKAAVLFPQPLLLSPASNVVQSVNSDVNLNGHVLTAGAVNASNIKISVKGYGAKGTGRTTTHAVTNGTTTVTGDSGTWEAGDVGKVYVGWSASIQGVVTTITGFTSSSQITVADTITAGAGLGAWESVADSAADSAAYTLACSAITARGSVGAVYFPLGNYLINTSCSISDAAMLEVIGDGPGSTASMGNYNAAAQPGNGSNLIWTGSVGGVVACPSNTGAPPAGIANAVTNCTAAENFMLKLSGKFKVSGLNLQGTQRASHGLWAGGSGVSTSFGWRVDDFAAGYFRQYCLVVGDTAADQGSSFGEATISNYSFAACGITNTTVAENDATGGGDVFMRYGAGNFQVSFEGASFFGLGGVNGSHHVYHYSGNLSRYVNPYFAPLTANGTAHSSVYVKSGNGFRFTSGLDENAYFLHNVGGEGFDIDVQLRQQTTTNPHFGMLFETVTPNVRFGYVGTSGLPLVFTAGGRITQDQVTSGSYGPFPAYGKTLCTGAGCTTRAGADITFTTTTTCAYAVNDWVTISTVDDATYNGTFAVTTACSGGSTFHVTNAAAVGASTQNGTVGLASGVVASTATNFAPQMSHPFVAVLGSYNGGGTNADILSAAATNLANKNAITFIYEEFGGAAGSSLPATIPAGWHFADLRSGAVTFFGGPFTWGSVANPVVANFYGAPRPGTAGGYDLGTAALPWGKVYLGTAATNNFILTPTATAAARTVTINDPLANSTWRTEISNTATVDLASVATAACSADSADVTVTGAAVGNSVIVTAATVLEAGGFLVGRVTASNTARFQFCNNSGGAIDRASDTYTLRVLK